MTHPKQGAFARTCDAHDPNDEEGVVEVAQRIISTACFLERECASTLFASISPDYAALRHLLKRLWEYSWPLVNENKPGRAFIDGVVPQYSLEDGIEAMRTLADFFARRATTVGECELAGIVEVGLATDLRRFARTFASLIHDSTKRPVRSTGALSQQRGPFVVEASSQERIHGPRSRHSTEPLDRSIPSSNSSQRGRCGLSNGTTGLNTPHDLRPHPLSPAHAPHVLTSSRLHSRYTPSEWAAFAEHPFRLSHWIAEPDAHTTVQIGHMPGISSHACGAEFLGLRGVRYLRLVHPLCAVEIKSLDIDILRFLEIILAEWIRNQRGYQNPFDAEASTARKVQERSLHWIHRQLACRQWEYDRLSLASSEESCSHKSETSLTDSPKLTTGHCTPHDLRPLPEHEHLRPHSLEGSRLRSRPRLEDDVQLAELTSQAEQWTRPAPAYYKTIHSMHGSESMRHFCDARVLGISFADILELQHPLDAMEVRALDMDILRFIRLMLWDWTNGLVQRVTTEECLAAQESLEIVRREVACRKWEVKQAALNAAQSPASISWRDESQPKQPEINSNSDEVCTGDDFLALPKPMRSFHGSYSSASDSDAQLDVATDVDKHLAMKPQGDLQTDLAAAIDDSASIDADTGSDTAERTLQARQDIDHLAKYVSVADQELPNYHRPVYNDLGLPYHGPEAASSPGEPSAEPADDHQPSRLTAADLEDYEGWLAPLSTWNGDDPIPNRTHGRSSAGSSTRAPAQSTNRRKHKHESGGTTDPLLAEKHTPSFRWGLLSAEPLSSSPPLRSSRARKRIETPS